MARKRPKRQFEKFKVQLSAEQIAEAARTFRSPPPDATRRVIRDHDRGVTEDFYEKDGERYGPIDVTWILSEW